MEEKIQRLKDIRIELTQIYLSLGNPKYVEADSRLNQDIALLEKEMTYLSSKTKGGKN